MQLSTAAAKGGVMQTRTKPVSGATENDSTTLYSVSQLPGQLGVTAIYQFNDGSPRDSLGTETATLSGNSILMPFDNTQGNVTAVAIANTNSTQALTVSMVFETDFGAQSTSSLVLQPHTQQTFVAPTLNPAVAGFRGLIKFTAPTPDIAIEGLEFTSSGQFTSLGTFQ